MNLIDRIAIDDKAKVRKTEDGYLVSMPRVSRTGVQLYKGSEVGKPELATVRVFRPDAEVFSADSLKSFGFKPLTNDHPDTPVTAETWADVAVGQIGPATARDGEFVRAEMLLMDAGAIAAVESGKAELSVGYSTDLVWGDGKTPDGLQFDAIQTNIRANHLAIVGVARGGRSLRIGDTKTMTTRKVLVDGITFDAEEQIASVLEKLMKDRDTATGALTIKDAKIGELTGALAVKDGEIVTLKKAVADSTITPAMIDAAVNAKMAVAVDAKKIMGDDFKTDGKDAALIRSEVVTAKLGDAAKTFDANAINGAFTALLASAAAGGSQGSGMADGMRHMAPASHMAATDKAWADANIAEQNRWKTAGDPPRVTQ